MGFRTHVSLPWFTSVLSVVTQLVSVGFALCDSYLPLVFTWCGGSYLMWIGPLSVCPSWSSSDAVWVLLIVLSLFAFCFFSMRNFFILLHYHMLDLWFILIDTMGFCYPTWFFPLFTFGFYPYVNSHIFYAMSRCWCIFCGSICMSTHMLLIVPSLVWFNYDLARGAVSHHGFYFHLWYLVTLCRVIF